MGVVRVIVGALAGMLERAQGPAAAPVRGRPWPSMVRVLPGAPFDWSREGDL